MHHGQGKSTTRQTHNLLMRWCCYWAKFLFLLLSFWVILVSLALHTSTTNLLVIGHSKTDKNVLNKRTNYKQQHASAILSASCNLHQPNIFYNKLTDHTHTLSKSSYRSLSLSLPFYFSYIHAHTHTNTISPFLCVK